MPIQSTEYVGNTSPGVTFSVHWRARSPAKQNGWTADAPGMPTWHDSDARSDEWSNTCVYGPEPVVAGVPSIVARRSVPNVSATSSCVTVPSTFDLPSVTACGMSRPARMPRDLAYSTRFWSVSGGTNSKKSVTVS